jgi:hypothetical protein
MSNPFVNLRKFVPDLADPKENHATESLAACLTFSPVLKAEFLRFLFGDTRLPVDATLADEIVVETQINIGKFGIIDLYLSVPDTLHIVIEVKVMATEDSTQLRDYHNWLKTQSGERFLFSLVGFPDRQFQFNQYGVLHRRTWGELYRFFLKLLPTVNATDKNIIELFNEYLEVQEIVITWKPSELTGLAKGIRARNALSSLFKLLSDRLPAASYQTKIYMSDTEWPRLEVGKQEWTRIFGKGYNNKLYLWFAVPPIWDEREHACRPEIILWNRQHANPWTVVQPKIKPWVGQLTKLGFTHFVEGRGIASETFDVNKSELLSSPARIVAYLESATIRERQIEDINEADLVNALYVTIVTHCKIIDDLD